MVLNSLYHDMTSVPRKGTTMSTKQGETVDEIGASSKFESYYEVLEVDEDYFPDEGTYVTEVPKRTKIDRERLFEEAFTDELRLEVGYFFMELDELMQSVWKAYVNVKREKRTMVEATVVVKLAMDAANTLTTQLQLKYPSLTTAKPLFNIVSPESFRRAMLGINDKFLQELKDSVEKSDGVVSYVPGMFLLDFVGVGTTLDSYIGSTPAGDTMGITFSDGCFGETYGEERTPDYVWFSDPVNSKVFLLQQLPLLSKTLLRLKAARGSTSDPATQLGSFTTVIEKFLTTREVTVPVIFACICWMKSVAALQGNAGLGHNISLTFKHSTQLMKSIEFTVAKGTIRTVHEKTDAFLQRFGADIKNSTNLRYLARANPLLAGLMMLDRHFLYLQMAHEMLLVGSKFRLFGHLYNVLVSEGYYSILRRYVGDIQRSDFHSVPSSGNAWLLLSQITA
ncbi:hypothetical protein PC116_g19011 [Phytophthora cactorum]|uniref:DUF6604 domain-containing protein n=2 Tax=Phytophthora cactorum TaxID=29920 RepID=A0A329RJ61_9STRA|nr:hypothetical protein Pcac1_g2469 [Phytophthora cactorum]KAG2923705.1 hypothetical protein PC117_g15651 [Phytophthora cactorum]KAG2935517.1 hypothetical protein PC114_g452 [Phytophthora cactorum]KAG3004899.1 hypothetical protein PC119_g15458 [Phytophthora cactorum]KAG3054942.1 hypothetical protein PC121_g16034 [Phytophthora cactorum]